MAERVAPPLTDGLRQVRTPVQSDDARFVDGLVEQHDRGTRLHDLMVAKRSGAGIGSAESRNAVGQASFDMSEIFRSVGRAPASGVAGRFSALRFDRQRRNAPVGAL